MLPLILAGKGFHIWDWINSYGAGIGALAGVIAAIVAVFALISAASDSRARSQPMITAEFRAAPENDIAAELVITNLGQTPARDVKVTFDPPIVLPADTTGLVAPFVVKRYEKPIAVLNPGQVLTNTWWIGLDQGGDERTNGEPTPEEVTVHFDYLGIGRRRLRDDYPLTMDTVKFTTYSTSSSSTKGRLKSIDLSLTRLAERAADLVTLLRNSSRPESS